MNACMLCEKESSEVTDVKFTNDNGEVIPIPINRKVYNSIYLCPDCNGAISIMFARAKISEMNKRDGE